MHAELSSSLHSVVSSLEGESDSFLIIGTGIVLFSEFVTLDGLWIVPSFMCLFDLLQSIRKVGLSVKGSLHLYNRQSNAIM